MWLARPVAASRLYGTRPRVVVQRLLHSKSTSDPTTRNWRLVQQIPLSNCVPKSRLQFQIASDVQVNLRFVPVVHQEQVSIQVFLNETHANKQQVQWILDAQTEFLQLVASSSCTDGKKKPSGGSFRLTPTASLSAAFLLPGKNQSQQLADKLPMEVDVQVQVPHLVDLNVSLANGNIVLHDKFEGNRMHLVVGHGDLAISKLRAEQIVLQTKAGDLTIQDLVEARSLKVMANNGGVRIQKILANSCELTSSSKRAQLRSNNIEIGAIYATTTFMKVHSCPVSLATTTAAADDDDNKNNNDTTPCGQFKIDTLHGYLHLSADDLTRIEIGSVNGRIDVEDIGSNCEARVHFDSVPKPDALPVAPSHEDQPESENSHMHTNKSSIMVARDVVVSMEPQIEMKVECHGKEVDHRNCRLKAITTDQLDDEYCIVTGQVKPKPESSTRAGFVGAGSGKINLQAAKQTAMATSFFAQDQYPQERDAWGANSAQAQPLPPPPPPPQQPTADMMQLVIHTQQARVTLEQLDWMQRIQRKHLSKRNSKRNS